MKNILIVGSMNIDLVVSVENMPVPGETVSGKDFSVLCGGKGANQACACGRLAGQAMMLGAVGDDSYGTILMDSLLKSNVDVSRVKKVAGVSTGTAIITVDDHAENSIVVVPGANNHVTCEYIDQNIDYIEQADIILLQLEIPMDTVIHVAKTAKALGGKTVILDPAPMPLALPEELIQYVDMIKPNEAELERLTQKAIAECGIEEQVVLLESLGVENVIITLGAEGSYVKEKNSPGKYIYAKKVKAIDTTAAGDTFIGGVATILGEGGSLESAVAFATIASGIVVTRKGAQSSIPWREEI